MAKLFKDMITFGIFYFSVLFLYGIVGFVLFSDLAPFAHINTALFTLFRATIRDYDIDIMTEA
jgi:hypothetical protein